MESRNALEATRRKEWSSATIERGHDVETEGGGVAADAVVERQHANVGEEIADRQRGGEMDGVEGSDRLAGKRPTGPMDDFRVDAVEGPMGGGSVDEGLQMRGLPGRQASRRDGAPMRSGDARCARYGVRARAVEAPPVRCRIG